MNVDLFGDLLGDPIKKPVKGTIPAGYVRPPGTGPAGETCGTCAHVVRIRLAKTYLKCGLNRTRWTGGPKTDIRMRSPACDKWAGE